MSIAERKGRQRAERESRIVAAARVIAEREGWNAVTIRRLAEEIEYSQPVLYSHFEDRNAIVTAVAVEGFQAFTVALREAARGLLSRPQLISQDQQFAGADPRCLAIARQARQSTACGIVILKR